MMRTRVLCGFIGFLLCGAGVFAQEQESIPGNGRTAALPGAIGLGLEMNMNSRDSLAGGAAVTFDYALSGPCAVGLGLSASYNFSGIAVIAPAAMFRWYFMGAGAAYTGLFAQADLGASIVIEEDLTTPLLFMGGLRAGCRFPLGKLWYVEPYGRAGYPFVFGLGAQAGIRF